MEWEPARVMCESLGAYLYWPNDAEEHQAVWETVPHGLDDIHFWTAIHQDFNVVSCSDANGGWAGPNNEPQTFFLWRAGEPSNGGGSNESVVQFEWNNDGMKWNDAPGQACDEGNNCDCRFSRVILERSTPTFCDDPAACNYTEGSLTNDGCDYSCCPGPGCCAEGMHWDWELGQCQNTLPGDTNGDGCVQLNDLLDVLSAYGNCAQAFTCGNPVSYQGYDYATVQIGDQCWFAENLRISQYLNGDSLASGLDQENWSLLGAEGIGSNSTYGSNGECLHQHPSIDACNPVESQIEFGRLYNWFAVSDERQICPANWHVSSDLDWRELEASIGLVDSLLFTNGWRGENLSHLLKSTSGWAENGNGVDALEFDGRAGGMRFGSGGYNHAGNQARWWTSSFNDFSEPYYRMLYSDRDGIYRGVSPYPSQGYSVRCVRDAE